MEHKKRLFQFMYNVYRAVVHRVPRIVLHPAVYKAIKKEHGLFLFYKVILHRLTESREHTLGYDSLDGIGCILPCKRKHSARGADAYTVVDKGADALLTLHILYPGGYIPALLEADRIEFASALSVTSRVENKNIASAFSVGYRKIVSVSQALGSAREDNRASFTAEIVILTVKVDSVPHYMNVLFRGDILFAPSDARLVHPLCLRLKILRHLARPLLLRPSAKGSIIYAV